MPGRPEPSDLDLLRGAARGDRRLANALLARHGPSVFGIALRMMRQRETAEDVVQEVFMKVWRHAASWEPRQAQFGTWLHRVTVNACLDRLRRRTEVPMGDDLPETTDEAPDVEHRLITTEEDDRVRWALGKLPERQRIAITLCHFEGLGNVEAAEIMNVSVEAIESLLSRGRRSLRDILNRQEG